MTIDIYVKKKALVSQNEINLTGRIVYIAGEVFAILCALGITRIQGLNFFNIFQSVLGFLELSMVSAFLLSVFWKRSTRRAMNLLLTTETIFSLETGILYFSGLILAKFHFLLILFLIFVTPTVVTITIIVLTEKANIKTATPETVIRYKTSGKTWILRGVLIAVMVTVYICFNGD